MKSKKDGLTSEVRPGKTGNKKVVTYKISSSKGKVKSMKPNLALKEWQSRNCKLCGYANQVPAALGLPCCNHIETIITNENGACLLMRFPESMKKVYACVDCKAEISSLSMYRFADNMPLCGKCRGE